MIRFLRSLFRRRRRRAPATYLFWGGYPGPLGGSAPPLPDPLLGLPDGHEAVATGTVRLDVFGEQVEATAYETRPIGASAGR